METRHAHSCNPNAEDTMAINDIKLVITDVDGVLTDGTVMIAPDGSETKLFNVHDWTGIKYLLRVGFHVAIVSGRESSAVVHRANHVGVTEVHQGLKDKLPAVRKVMAHFGVKAEETAYIGDDLPDIPPAVAVGFAVAVADAHEELKACCDHVTSAAGGTGAVREVAELLIKGRNKWDTIMQRYIDAPDQ